MFIYQGEWAACNNNCKGVDPNSIIGAGVAAVAATGIAASSLMNIAGIFTIGTLAGEDKERNQEQCQYSQTAVF